MKESKKREKEVMGEEEIREEKEMESEGGGEARLKVPYFIGKWHYFYLSIR